MEQIAKITGKNIKLLSKYIAPIVIAIYASGFLIFSLHCASYGFFDSNPLKTRVLAAGSLFLFLSATPLILASEIAKNFDFEDGTPIEGKNLKKTIIASLQFTILSYMVAQTIFNQLFIKDLQEHQNEASFTSPFYIALVFALILGIISIIFKAKDYDEKYHRLGIFLFSATLVSIITTAVLGAETSSHMKLTLWFFFIGALSAYTNNCIKREVGTAWERVLLPCALIGIFIYSTTIYPKINFSWGGGNPVPAIVYLKSQNETFLLAETKIRGKIIDETSDGLFFIPANQTNAIFIPASSVSGIYYSSQPLFIDNALKEPYGPWQLP